MAHLPPRLRDAATATALTLRGHGHRAWLVGGCVRDLALGREVGDADLCSSAPPALLLAAFPRTVPVGIEFGTVVVVHDGVSIEHTTYRTEAGYSDGRRPDTVAFGADAAEDARRRDFTVNALYLDPLTDELYDPQGGMEDLRLGRLRAIGDARERFEEDALRLLRLVRFGAVLGFELDPATEAAARGCARLLAGMARERVHKELAGVCARGALDRFLLLLERCALVEPAFGRPLPDIPARCRLLADWPRPCSLGEGLAAMLVPLRGDADERAAATAIVEGLKCSREEADHVGAAHLLLSELLADPLAARAVRVRRARQKAFGTALSLAGRLRPGDERLARVAHERAGWDEADLHPAPWLKADDLLELGVPRGPRLGQLLRDLETAQLDGLLDDRAAAIAFVRARM